MASSLYFSFVNQYSLGGGFPFPIVLVPRYKLSLCHTPIKPDLLGFPGIGVFTCGLRDHVITKFASYLVLDVASSVKYVFPLLIDIIFFDLHVQHTPYNQDLSFNKICDEDQLNTKRNHANDPLEVPNGQLTRARAKKLKQALNEPIQNIWSKMDLEGLGIFKEHEGQSLIHLIQVQEEPNSCGTKG